MTKSLKYFYIVSVFTVLIFQGKLVRADIEVPEDELAKETVLPKFENSVSVKSKNVDIAKKFEFGLFGGVNFSEPIYNQFKIGGNLGYHWSEESGVVINFSKWLSGLNTQYTDSLYANQNLDFNLAPKPNYSIWANYELTSYYGKISLTKNGVMNIHLYPILGLGMTSFDYKSFFGMNGGVGWKFYFSPHWALRLDLKLQYSQAPSPFLRGKMTKGMSAPQPSSFEEKWTLGTIVDLGIAAIF